MLACFSCSAHGVKLPPPPPAGERRSSSGVAERPAGRVTPQQFEAAVLQHAKTADGSVVAVVECALLLSLLREARWGLPPAPQGPACLACHAAPRASGFA